TVLPVSLSTRRTSLSRAFSGFKPCLEYLASWARPLTHKTTLPQQLATSHSGNTSPSTRPSVTSCSHTN
ncbi:hypothetical protein LTR16_010442, partial [Cryomyces antarcticus]